MYAARLVSKGQPGDFFLYIVETAGFFPAFLKNLFQKEKKMEKTVFLALFALVLATTTAARAADLNKDEAAAIARDCRGIGPKIAAQIVEARAAAPLADWEDAEKRIRGIGPAKRANLEKDEKCTISATPKQ